MSKNEIDNLCNEKQEGIPNILIVDDDSELARFMLEILARKGLRGHLANDKENAISFIPTAVIGKYGNVIEILFVDREVCNQM